MTFSMLRSTPGLIRLCLGSGIERAPSFVHQVWLNRIALPSQEPLAAHLVIGSEDSCEMAR